MVGGGQVYETLIDQCSKVFLTRVDMEVEGDTYFDDSLLAGFRVETSSVQDVCDFLVFTKNSSNGQPGSWPQ